MLNPNLEKKRAFLINIAFLGTLLMLCYFVLKHGLPVAIPFVIAWVVAMLAEPFIRLLGRLRVPRGLASIIALLGIFGLLGWLAVVVVSRVAYEAAALAANAPAIGEMLANVVNSVADGVENLFSLLPETVGEHVAEYVENTAATLVAYIPGYITSLITPIVGIVTGMAVKLPSFLISTLVTVTACILLSADFQRVNAFLNRQVPDNLQAMVLETKQFFKLTVGRLVRAYVIICSITFVELFIGMQLMKMEYAFSLALLIALFDVLPVVGCGTIMIPWAAVAFITGDTRIGIAVSALYLVITVVRQLVEPKIVADNIGLPPLVALMAIYLGLRTMGIIGMFVMLIVAIMVKHLQDKGYIRLWRNLHTQAPSKRGRKTAQRDEAAAPGPAPQQYQGGSEGIPPSDQV